LTLYNPSDSIWINKIILSYQERRRDRPVETSAADHLWNCANSWSESSQMRRDDGRYPLFIKDKKGIYL